MNPYLQLLDYRRRVHALYAEVRALHRDDPRRAHARWRAARDELFARHPQSALDAAQRAAFTGLRYFPYNPGLVFRAEVEADDEPVPEAVGTSGADPLAFHRFGWVDLPIGRLAVYWLDAYGGGRYLLYPVKGADLGATEVGALLLDFNFAYHPSCHYNPIWVCPLAPPANRLAAPVEAGEQV